MLRDAPLTISRREGKAPDTHVIKLAGPITLPNLFAFQDELHSAEPPAVVILDLTEVPYMDSAGIGAIINYFVHCRKRDAKLIVAGVNSRPLELFKLARVDSVIPMAATIEEAEARA